jgi:hypothetical protein
VYTQVFTTFKPMMIAISQAAKTRRRTTATVSREFMVDWCILLLFVGGVLSRQHRMFNFVLYKAANDERCSVPGASVSKSNRREIFS